MNSYILLGPVLALGAMAFLLLGLDSSPHPNGKGLRRAGVWAALIGILAAGALIVPVGPAPIFFGRHMLVWDGLSYFLSWISVLTLFFVVLMSDSYKELEGTGLGAYFALLLLAGAGLILLASANDFLMIFLAIELVSIPSFILSGYLRQKEKSNEAAITFFLMGTFSAALLAYGISILYGLTGSTSLTALQQSLPLLIAKPSIVILALFLILVSFGFEIALVPFHLWVPDVFEGAPTPVAAFLSVAPKVAGAILALRIFGLCFVHPSLGMLSVLAVLAALTMTVANIVALQQSNVVRLLAYSSIAHMGYLILGLVAGTEAGFSSVFLYGGAYLFMNLGAFALVIAAGDAVGSNELSAYDGLARRQPFVGILFVLFFLSLAGMPPTGGFFAKFYSFAAAWDAGWHGLVVIATVNTVISAGYYLKILKAMYFGAVDSPKTVPLKFPTLLTLGVTALMTLLLGVAPQFAVEKSNHLVRSLIAFPAPVVTAVAISTGTVTESGPHP